jgi:hypothetical protein
MLSVGCTCKCCIETKVAGHHLGGCGESAQALLLRSFDYTVVSLLLLTTLACYLLACCLLLCCPACACIVQEAHRVGYSAVCLAASAVLQSCWVPSWSLPTWMSGVVVARHWRTPAYLQGFCCCCITWSSQHHAMTASPPKAVRMQCTELHHVAAARCCTIH